MPLLASSSSLINQAAEPPINHAVTPSTGTAQQLEHVEHKPDSRVEDSELFDINSKFASRLSSLYVMENGENQHTFRRRSEIVVPSERHSVVK